ncbi:hypothetical protein HDU98_000471 [Podochytrium sp. JEL0797]|nr:hypothetical protein HDU98_000471 [Podochytrium sp. JEL0797]
MATEHGVLAFVASREWNGKPTNPPIKATLLSGGISNFVWRVDFADAASVIVKHFPPFVRANPSFEYPQARGVVEHGALKAVQNSTRFGSQCGPTGVTIDAPTPLLFDADASILIMSLAPGEGLYELLKKPGKVAPSDVQWIANGLMGCLEGLTSLAVPDTSLFQNSPTLEPNAVFFSTIPTVAVQYGFDARLVVSWLQKAALNESRPDSVNQIIHGDFWPNSILVDLETRRLFMIDFEHCRTGHCGVDFGHFVGDLLLMEQDAEFDHDVVIMLRKQLLGEWGILEEKRGGEAFDLQSSVLKRLLQLATYHSFEIEDIGEEKRDGEIARMTLGFSSMTRRALNLEKL